VASSKAGLESPYEGQKGTLRKDRKGVRKCREGGEQRNKKAQGQTEPARGSRLQDW
jgi:hypothetical protein